MQAGRKLTLDFKITQTDKDTMTEEELETKIQRKKDEVARIRSEFPTESSAPRMGLFRLYGNHKQFNFLRQQRGCIRLLYNQSLTDFRNQVRTNRNNFARHASWIMDYEVDSNITLDDMVALDEQTWRLVEWYPFDMTYFRDTYRNVESPFCQDRPWFTTSTTSNLRDAVLSNLDTSINEAEKPVPGLPSPSSLARRRRPVGARRRRRRATGGRGVGCRPSSARLRDGSKCMVRRVRRTPVTVALGAVPVT